MNALTVPTQRAVRLMTTTYNWDAPLLGSMTPLERAAVAQYAVEKLQALGPLSPLEALVGARSLNKTKRTKMLRTVRAEYPQLTASYLEEMSSLDKHYRHTHFSQYDARTQLLIAQCEAVHLRLESIADPLGHRQQWPHYDLGSWLLTQAPRALAEDALLQRILTSKSPQMFWPFIENPHGLNIDSTARALAFLYGEPPPTSHWYTLLDDNAFAGLIAVDTQLDKFPHLFELRLHRNPSLHHYPWDKMHVVLAEHPARFFAALTSVKNMANATEHVAKWFVPALDALGTRIAKDPSYTQHLGAILALPKFEKTLARLLKSYAPQEHNALQVLQHLHPCNPNSAQASPAVQAWLQWLAQDRRPLLDVELPALGL